MEKQRELAREHWKGSGEEGIAEIYKQLHSEGVRSQFTGYDHHSGYGVVKALVVQGVSVAEAPAGSSVDLVCDATPFYGASGGQAGDTGTISSGNAHLTRYRNTAPLYRSHHPPLPG